MKYGVKWTGDYYSEIIFEGTILDAMECLNSVAQDAAETDPEDLDAEKTDVIWQNAIHLTVVRHDGAEAFEDNYEIVNLYA